MWNKDIVDFVNDAVGGTNVGLSHTVSINQYRSCGMYTIINMKQM